jgi:hypothetical protein
MAPENIKICQILQAGMILWCRTSLWRSGRPFLQYKSKLKESKEKRVYHFCLQIFKSCVIICDTMAFTDNSKVNFIHLS